MMQPETSHRGRFDAQVERNELICREHYRLRLRIAGETGRFPATQPGQFVQVGCRPPDSAANLQALQGHELECRPGQPMTLRQPELCGPHALLRRPFSLAGRADDERGTWIEVIHRVVGVGTAWMANLKPGDAVDVIGPLGNAFGLTEGKSIGLMVGGGVGLPPMFYLAQALRQANWQGVGFVGAMTRDLLAVTMDLEHAADAQGTPSMCAAEFAHHGYQSVLTTDDGTFGLRGRITDGLSRYLDGQTPEQARQTVIFTCGPEPMMQAVARLAQARGIECQACVEQAMACGMGTCQSCVVRIEEPVRPHGETSDHRPWCYKLACTDGPVFPAESIIWGFMREPESA